MSRLAVVCLFSISTALGGGWVYASTSKANDASVISSAKVSLVEAIATAEQHVQGKASRAEFESGKNGPKADVEVVTSAGKVFDVEIDATRNVVIAAVEDKLDVDERDERD